MRSYLKTKHKGSQVAQDGLEFLALLPLPPKSRDHCCASPPHLCLSSLEQEHEGLEQENAALRREIVKLKEELRHLSEALREHEKMCPLLLCPMNFVQVRPDPVASCLPR